MLQTTMKAAREAGRVLIAARESRINVLQQKGADVKLEMDRRAEDAIVAVLTEAYPDHSILTEESGRLGKASEYEWVVDPLDGSYNYLKHIPIWATSIALRKGGEEVIGVIYDPSRDEMFHTEKGKGAFLNGRPIFVSDAESVTVSTIAFASGPHGERMERIAEAIGRLMSMSRKVRAMGSAALQLAYVACGRVDAFFQFGLFDWDVAAGMALIREAGGRVSIRRHDDTTLDIVATNGRIHQELMEQLRWGADQD